MAHRRIRIKMYVECSAADSAFENTGALEQCLEGLTIRTAVGIPGFKFDSIEDAKDITKWNEAIAAKQLFPLYEAEEWTSANTEDTIFEGRSRQYVTANGKKIITYSSFLGLCSYRALRSFNKKDVQLFEFTEDKAILAVHTESDGSIKGQDVVLNIGQRLPATADRPPSVLVTINYKDRDQLELHGAILRPDWNPIEIQGIFDVTLVQVEATSTSIKFKAITGCAGGDTPLLSLETADIELLDTAGDAHPFSFVEADADGVYELTGTGFETGFTVGLDGVVIKTEGVYESPSVLVIDLTAPSV